MDKGKAILIDNFDKDGNLIGIEVFDNKGEFVLEVVWDDREAQTQENRVEFRKWAREVVMRYGYEIVV